MAITRNGGGAVVSATTSRAGITQLTDSISSTSTTTAATPNSVKTAYDLANTANTTAGAAVPKSTVTTAGDLILGSGSGTVTRLGVGTNGQVPVSNGTTLVYGTPTDTTKIPLSTVTTAGDLILGSGSSTVTRLAIGTTGYLLTSNGTTAEWAVAPTSGLTANDANLAFAVQVFA